MSHGFPQLMTGAIFGNFSSIGIYMGMASFLNQGDTDLALNTNKFFYAGTNTTRVARDLSLEDGAPEGPLHVCVTEIVDGKCSPGTPFSRGAFKFSIFGLCRVAVPNVLPYMSGLSR